MKETQNLGVICLLLGQQGQCCYLGGRGVWKTPEEEHNLELFGAPVDPGGSVMVQGQLKMCQHIARLSWTLTHIPIGTNCPKNEQRGNPNPGVPRI